MDKSKCNEIVERLIDEACKDMKTRLGWVIENAEYEITNGEDDFVVPKAILQALLLKEARLYDNPSGRHRKYNESHSSLALDITNRI